MKNYTITIQNKSGAPQNYVLVNETPRVSPDVSDIWLGVLQKESVPPGDRATFQIFDRFGGVTGASSGRPGPGVHFRGSYTMEVELGSSDEYRGPMPGTTLEMTVSHGAPQFARSRRPNGASAGSFQIVTDGNFRISEAENNNYLIGHGVNIDGDSVPAAVFVPKPNETYQIQPVKKFFVASGDFQQGTLVKSETMRGAVVSVDFGSRGNNNATIVHDETGRLTVQN